MIEKIKNSKKQNWQKSQKTKKKLQNLEHLCIRLVASICVCLYVSIGRKQTGGRRCQTVGMEDPNQPGKLRKFECCPVKSSNKKSKQNLVKGVAFIGDEDDYDCDDYVQNDDFLDDDDQNDDDDDDDDDNDDLPPHPSQPDPDQHDHSASTPSPQHAQSYDYVSDDEFVTDAGIHTQYMCIRSNFPSITIFLYFLILFI